MQFIYIFTLRAAQNLIKVCNTIHIVITSINYTHEKVNLYIFLFLFCRTQNFWKTPDIVTLHDKKIARIAIDVVVAYDTQTWLISVDGM